MITINLVAHWVACFWRLVPELEMVEDRGSNVNWMVSYGCEDDSNPEVYLVALYFAVMTVTTIGYGDVGAQTNGERLLATMTMVSRV